MKIKGTINGQTYEAEIDEKQFKRLRSHEEPHIHHSKPHPSANIKICDLCQKKMVKHYHVCEDCYKFMKESLIQTIRKLEKRIKELEKTK